MVRFVQVSLMLGYVGFALAAIWVPHTARVFWTMLMPALPLAIVLVGFHRWRLVCPIALLARLGRARTPRSTLRPPRWLRRWPLGFALSCMGGCLALRHLVTNGGGIGLGAFLISLAGGAWVVNGLFGGKSWCSYACPVGVVERIYTDGMEVAAGRSSACAPCTGCTKSCPDIDQRRAMEADLFSADRRVAFYAFPGMVAGFYLYFWLRAGEWDAYYDGRWTTASPEPFGPGFFFAPWVPAVVAAPISLLATSALSVATGLALEATIADVAARGRVARNRALALASFAAFNLFYAFAGAPTLLLLPGASRAVALAAACVATVVLMRRWQAGAPSTQPSRARIALRVVA